MKKIILCFTVLMPFSFLYAQKNLKKDSPLFPWKGKDFIVVDSFNAFTPFSPQLRKAKPAIGFRMPNSLPVTGFNTYEYHFLLNSKDGFDIYESRRDGMPVLKPDSSFVSGMPVLKKE